MSQSLNSRIFGRNLTIETVGLDYVSTCTPHTKKNSFSENGIWFFRLCSSSFRLNAQINLHLITKRNQNEKEIENENWFLEKKNLNVAEKVAALPFKRNIYAKAR